MLKDRIKTARESAGLSRSELARIVKVSRSSITMWENGTVNKLEGSNLIKTARALMVSPTWLATGEGDPDPTSTEEVIVQPGENPLAPQPDDIPDPVRDILSMILSMPIKALLQLHPVIKAISDQHKK